jgi:hypothetical protein
VSRLLKVSPILAVTLYQFVGGFCRFNAGVMRPLSLVLALIIVSLLGYQGFRHQTSGVDMTMGVYLLLAAIGVWIMPESLGHLMALQPVTVLYALLFFMAVLGLGPRAEPFTTFYARRIAPPEVWETPLFKLINWRLTAFWATLFALSAISAFIPQFWPVLHTPLLSIIFAWGIPLILMIGIGVRLTKWYPAFMTRRHLAQKGTFQSPR